MTEPPRPPGWPGAGDDTADSGDPPRPPAPGDPAQPPPPDSTAGAAYPPGPTAEPGYPPGPAAEPRFPPGPTTEPEFPPGPPAGTGYPPGPTSGAEFPPGPTSGGGYPPAGGFGGPGYPPGGGYPQGGHPGGYGGGAGYPSQDDRTWALVAHFGGPIGVVVGGGLLGWVAPLIAMMGRGQQSPIVRAHAVAALNFQLTWTLATVLSWVATAITCGVLIFVPALIWLVPVIFGIIGGVKANEGQLYRYPASYPFVK